MESEGKLYRTPTGFIWDSGGAFTWLVHYSEDGVYCGQTQSDVMGEGDIFIRPEMINGIPHVNGKPAASLTHEEMQAAA